MASVWGIVPSDEVLRAMQPLSLLLLVLLLLLIFVKSRWPTTGGCVNYTTRHQNFKPAKVWHRSVILRWGLGRISVAQLIGGWICTAVSTTMVTFTHHGSWKEYESPPPDSLCLTPCGTQTDKSCSFVKIGNLCTHFIQMQDTVLKHLNI